MMDWIPVVFVAFKVLVLGIGMFYAVKWHYDQGRRKKGNRDENETRAVLRAGGALAVVFALSLAGLGCVTFLVARMLGMDVAFP